MWDFLFLNWCIVGERANVDAGNEKLRCVSLCSYIISYRANTSLGAKEEAILSLSGRPGGGAGYVKGVGR